MRLHYRAQLELNSTPHNTPISWGTLSREGCLLRRPLHTSGRDIHPNRCANLNKETQVIRKKQGNMTLPKVHNSPVTDSKDALVDEMPGTEFIRIIFLKSSMNSKRIK